MPDNARFGKIKAPRNGLTVQVRGILASVLVYEEHLPKIKVELITLILNKVPGSSPSNISKSAGSEDDDEDFPEGAVTKRKVLTRTWASKRQ